jgi:parallel beta-helix repeat protein
MAWRRRALAVLIVCLLLSTSAFGGAERRSTVPAQSPRPITLYVAADGDDGWSGRRRSANAERSDGPFATITRARDAIRVLPAAVRRARRIIISIRGGVYRLSEPLVFTPQDSGTMAHPVTYQASRGETPVWSGGRRIAGWTKTEGGLWKAHVPAAAKGEWQFGQLFVNGRRAQRARMPNPGSFFLVEGKISSTGPATFRYRGSDINPAWAQRGDVEVIPLLTWTASRLKIRSVDPTTKTVTLSGPVLQWGAEWESDPRYWVENTRDALDQPGEWYLDRRSEDIYYLPRPGEDMAAAEVIASTLAQLVRFEGDPAQGAFVHDIAIRGLTFAHTDWTLPADGYTETQAAVGIPAALEANGANRVTIQRCQFTHLGGYALAFARGCHDISIDRNQIADIGAGGIKIGETEIRQEAADQTRGVAVTNNHIHDIGIVYPAAVGIWVGQSAGNRLAHNRIHDTYYSAMSVGWTWGYGPTNARDNVIEYNLAHDIGRGMLSDMGAIYTLGVQPGTVIRHNLFHDIRCQPGGYGGWGIYLDEGSTSILAEDNVVYNTATGGFHQHYGKENTVRNNIFAFSARGQLQRTRPESHLSFTFARNIVYWTDGSLLDGNWLEGQVSLDHNLYFNAVGRPITFAGKSLTEWQAAGRDLHSLIADPRFVNPKRHNFALKPDSPALRLGFRPIDLRGVGPQ